MAIQEYFQSKYRDDAIQIGVWSGGYSDNGIFGSKFEDYNNR